MGGERRGGGGGMRGVAAVSRWRRRPPVPVEVFAGAGAVSLPGTRCEGTAAGGAARGVWGGLSGGLVWSRCVAVGRVGFCGRGTGYMGAPLGSVGGLGLGRGIWYVPVCRGYEGFQSKSDLGEKGGA